LRAFVSKYPASPFADEVLNNLASAFIIDDQDEQADAVFREVVQKYPAGRFAERAAWKAGWWAYRQGRCRARRVLIGGAAQFPRSDYRPSWLCIGRPAPRTRAATSGPASTRLRLTATDYPQLYYGRLAVKRLAERGGGRSRCHCSASRCRRQCPRRSDRAAAGGRLNREAMGE
jgi:hypothetical protein